MNEYIIVFQIVQIRTNSVYCIVVFVFSFCMVLIV